MSMQLFSFGHPCEHQLRRVCIGGTGCPLNGYPDTWCCSFVKGRINFKRDKPCEGQRCRWGFNHPTTQQFDAVHALIVEARSIAARIDDDTAAWTATDPLHDLSLSGQHPTDLALCAMHYVKTGQSRAGRRYGYLFALAALKAGDAKVLHQLLRTCKKPFDSCLVGAWEAVTRSPPQKGATKLTRQVFDDLREEIVEGLTATLSKDGKLICREEQLSIHPIFVQVLRNVPGRLKKKAGELLEEANTTFPLGSSNMPSLPGTTSESAVATPQGERKLSTKDEGKAAGQATKSNATKPLGDVKAEVVVGSEPIEVAEDIKQKFAEAPALPPADGAPAKKKGAPASATQQQPSIPLPAAAQQQARQSRAPVALAKPETPKAAPTAVPAPKVSTPRQHHTSNSAPPTVPTSAVATPSAVPMLGRSILEEFEGLTAQYNSLGSTRSVQVNSVPDILVLNGLFALQPEGPIGSTAPLGAASKVGFSVADIQSRTSATGWRTPPASLQGVSENSASWRGSQSDLASPFTPHQAFSAGTAVVVNPQHQDAAADMLKLMEGVKKAWGTA